MAARALLKIAKYLLHICYKLSHNCYTIAKEPGHQLLHILAHSSYKATTKLLEKYGV